MALYLERQERRAREMPAEPPLRKVAKILITCASASVFFTLLALGLSLYGIIDTALARSFMATAWLVAVVGVCVSDYLCYRSRTHVIATMLLVAVVGGSSLIWLDGYAARKKTKMDARAQPPLLRAPGPQIPIIKTPSPREMDSTTTGPCSNMQIRVKNHASINCTPPPLKLHWTTRLLAASDNFQYRQAVIVTGDVALKPVSLIIVCNQEIKEVSPVGYMIRPDFGVTQQSNKIGLVYYENPPLAPGVSLTIMISAANPFSVLDVRRAVIKPNTNAADPQ
jgi:hypothetical protein